MKDEDKILEMKDEDKIFSIIKREVSKECSISEDNVYIINKGVIDEKTSRFFKHNDKSIMRIEILLRNIMNFGSYILDMIEYIFKKCNYKTKKKMFYINAENKDVFIEFFITEDKKETNQNFLKTFGKEKTISLNNKKVKIIVPEKEISIKEAKRRIRKIVGDKK